MCVHFLKGIMHNKNQREYRENGIYVGYWSWTVTVDILLYCLLILPSSLIQCISVSAPRKANLKCDFCINRQNAGTKCSCYFFLSYTAQCLMAHRIILRLMLEEQKKCAKSEMDIEWRGKFRPHCILTHCASLRQRIGTGIPIFHTSVTIFFIPQLSPK